ncbi:MAG: site-specific DNA-methyltransferase [Deltaproteobacteria bacterium]|jgi:DNA modification methylase/DNA-directed RNA polymerase subunit RPC12/RpoP|nr:site-specific DNA-methyltransferase [Deltaproteobacteria bacterium]
MKNKEPGSPDSREGSGPVICLGLPFENDGARRAYFTEELRKKLRDRKFREIEGFPIGDDEDILRLSDPPYYTACPNPWLGYFIAEWEALKPEHPEIYRYHHRLFTSEVREDINDLIYKSHRHRTNMPHKEIMRYILHYTEPGDIVFDGFCGYGMAGVAAQLCGDRAEVMALGYQVKADGTILREDTGKDGIKKWLPYSTLGVRRAFLNDLSPAATFISYNYNAPVNPASFKREGYRVIDELEKACGWMYETSHYDEQPATINYTVWADLYVCSECSGEVAFVLDTVDGINVQERGTFTCPRCKAKLIKKRLERAWVNKFDAAIGETIRQAKTIPIWINYSVNGLPGRFEKIPDEVDFALISRIEGEDIPYWYPTSRTIEGRESKRYDPMGITHSHHFYTKRNLRLLATLRHMLSDSNMEKQLLCIMGDELENASKMHDIANSRLKFELPRTDGHFGSAIFVPLNQIECCVIPMLRSRIDDVFLYLRKRDEITRQVIFTSSSEKTLLLDDSLDYLIFDLPRGANNHFSKLNTLWEAWLKVLTNNAQETLENQTPETRLEDYRRLMVDCFREAYRLLKPGRWLTVKLSSTKVEVWDCVQAAITEAGFKLSNVSMYDKKEGGFKTVTISAGGRQELVISAYKSGGGFEVRFQDEWRTEKGAWDLVRGLLQELRVMKWRDGLPWYVKERQPRVLFDQIIALYVRNGIPVPISRRQFLIGLTERFLERDGMYFLPDQVAQYDRKRMPADALLELSTYITDEATAIQWLYRFIKEKPQKYTRIYHRFKMRLGFWGQNEPQLHLSDLLKENFLSYDGKGPVPGRILSYFSDNPKERGDMPEEDQPLGKARELWYLPNAKEKADLEKLREDALLKEFEDYEWLKSKLKFFRLEAVLAGFKKAWREGNYGVIVALARKIPKIAIKKEPEMAMWIGLAAKRVTAMQKKLERENDE